MRSYLVAYVKHFYERSVRHICKMEIFEIRAVIKYFCKKGIPPKEIHEDFMETFGKESPSYRTVKDWCLRGEERALRMMDALAVPKMPALMKMSRFVHTLVMCDRRRDIRSIANEVGISFGAVQSILTVILGMSKVSARWVPPMLIDDQKRTGLDISRYVLFRYEDASANFIEQVVTKDETGVHHFDQESKMQTKQLKRPGSPPTMKFKRDQLIGKVIA